MSAICRIYERTNGGMKLIAQIRDGKVTGRKAASVREVLKQCGFPNTPIEAAIDYLLMTMPGLGIAYIPAKERP